LAPQKKRLIPSEDQPLSFWRDAPAILLVAYRDFSA